MGLDVSCHAIYGVEVERTKKKILKTKYNGDTGEPYLAGEEVEVMQIVGTDIELDYALHKLTCVDCEDDKGWFFGAQIASSESHRKVDGKSWFELPVMPSVTANKVKRMLEEVGCPLRPKLYIYQHFSY